MRCALSGDEAHRLCVAVRPPGMRRHGAGMEDLFILSWDGRDVSEKPAKARGRWYTADLTERRVRDAAHDARQGAALVVRAAGNRPLKTMRLHCPVRATSKCARDRAGLAVRGGVRMRLPHNAGIETTLDDDAFRRAVATESGPFPDPPASGEMSRPRGGRVRSRRARSCGTFASSSPRRMNNDSRRRSMTASGGGDLKRRVQHYGWRYDYSAGQVDSSMRLGGPAGLGRRHRTAPGCRGPSVGAARTRSSSTSTRKAKASVHTLTVRVSPTASSRLVCWSPGRWSFTNEARRSGR